MDEEFKNFIFPFRFETSLTEAGPQIPFLKSLRSAKGFFPSPYPAAHSF